MPHRLRRAAFFDIGVGPEGGGADRFPHKNTSAKCGCVYVSGATEIAGVDIVAWSKMQGWTSREWTLRE